mmetsp:Transcript_59001/g.120867  ORF Transcript_59001/g.120867 Transcript_59001/m.120867 type:complete len:326 (+) Transcript_59001:103-1080(+)
MTTVHVMAWPGANRVSRGMMPFQSAATPSSLAMSWPVWSQPVYLGVSPAAKVCAIMRVLMTSTGAFMHGPTAPANSPLRRVFHKSRVFPSPGRLSQRYSFKRAIDMKLKAWLEPWRITVGVLPDHMRRTPSSRMTLTTTSTGPLYLRFLRPFCFCSRVLMTSNGVTIIVASMQPTDKPEKKLILADVLPESPPFSAVRMVSNRPNLKAYLSMRWTMKGDSPLYNARGPSSDPIVFKQWNIPRYFPAASSWRRVFATSRGWRVVASARPPAMPATSLTNGVTLRFFIRSANAFFNGDAAVTGGDASAGEAAMTTGRRTGNISDLMV